jgi:hypothetical protein
MASKPFVAVIGGRNAGKSTIIRSLTGCSGATFRGFVEDHATGKKIYVVASSPQEERLDIQELRSKLKLVAKDRSLLGFVIAIQPTRPRSRISMEDIFACAREVSGFSMYAFLVEPKYGKASARYDEVKSRLQPFPVRLAILDGRRFAYLNAAQIQKTTGLPA